MPLVGGGRSADRCAALPDRLGAAIIVGGVGPACLDDLACPTSRDGVRIAERFNAWLVMRIAYRRAGMISGPFVSVPE
jgi:hypothetical protein